MNYTRHLAIIAEMREGIDTPNNNLKTPFSEHKHNERLWDIREKTGLHCQDSQDALVWAIDALEDIYNNEPDNMEDTISEQADSATSIYNDEVMDWTSRNYRLVDEYIEEMGIDIAKDGIVKLCRGAIYINNERLLDALHEYITSQIKHD